MIDFSEIEAYYGPLSVEDLDAAVAAVQNADSTPDASHTGNLITSAAVATGLAAKADKADLASISITGTTNNTGATIPQGTFFYLSGTLVRAKADIANGATLTSGTNYEAVTDGGLNSVIKKKVVEFTTETLGTSFSPTSRRIGTCTSLFGVAATRILSIGVGDCALNPAAVMIAGLYGDDLYLAATQSTTLSDTKTTKIKIIYI